MGRPCLALRTVGRSYLAIVTALWCSSCGERFSGGETTAPTTGGGTGGDAAGAGHGGEGASGHVGGGTGSGASGASGGGGGVSGGGGGQGPTGGAGGGVGAVVATVALSSFSMGCTAGGEDPVYGGFTARYDNTAGTGIGAASVVSASISMFDADGQSLTWTFDVTPPGSGPVTAGEIVQVVHDKTLESGAGTGTPLPCDCCGSVYCLEVVWNVAGELQYATWCPGALACL